MWENVLNFFKNISKKEQDDKSKTAAKERLHLVLMQDRANVSADFLELMKQEIIDVIKKYIEVDENEIDVRLTNKANTDGTTGAPALYANIPIMSLKNEAKKASNDVIKREEELKKAAEKAIRAEKKKSARIRKKNEVTKVDKDTLPSKNSSLKTKNKEIIDGKDTKTAAAKAAFNKMTSKIKSMQK